MPDEMQEFEETQDGYKPDPAPDREFDPPPRQEHTRPTVPMIPEAGRNTGDPFRDFIAAQMVQMNTTIMSMSGRIDNQSRHQDHLQQWMEDCIGGLHAKIDKNMGDMRRQLSEGRRATHDEVKLVSDRVERLDERLDEISKSYTKLDTNVNNQSGEFNRVEEQQKALEPRVRQVEKDQATLRSKVDENFDQRKIQGRRNWSLIMALISAGLGMLSTMVCGLLLLQVKTMVSKNTKSQALQIPYRISPAGNFMAKEKPPTPIPDPNPYYYDELGILPIKRLEVEEDKR